MTGIALRCLALAAALVPLSGCAQGFDFGVHADNGSGEPVEVRFRATMDDGSVVSEVTDIAPPGRSTLGRVGGSPGDYVLDAWASGGHHQIGPLALGAGSRCSVLVGGPDAVRITCALA